MTVIPTGPDAPGDESVTGSHAPLETGEATPEQRVSEGVGASLGEAKWAAAKVLEHRFPGIGADELQFEVLSEGSADAGPARVRAEADLEAWRVRDDSLSAEPVERVRALVNRVVSGLELRASVDVEETEEEIRATVNGEDLGLLIGRHGSTIDAVQHLAARSAFRGAAERKRVIVDAAGYRERREAQLQRAADRAAEEALSFDRPVELEPMVAHERKAVHQYLSERTDVETHSEGDEPERRLVVSPVAAPRS